MKKILLIALTALQTHVFAQAVPNGQFENWTSYAYDEVSGWNSANQRDVQRLGTASITKVTGFSGFAMRIQTNVVGTDTSESYIINTNPPCSDPPQWKGGVPYSQQPTAITGYYRYNLTGNDTAILIIIFRKNGVHIGDNLIKIRGTGNQSTFAPFSFTVACAGTPDSLIIAAAPSNKITNKGVSNGSYIELDNLAFSGATQAIPNGNFENWTTGNYDMPGGWATNNTISKTTSSYSGTYALRLETEPEQCGGNANPGTATNGYLSMNNGPKGGRLYTNMTDTLCGYYKFVPAGNDTAAVYINLMKNGSPVGGAIKKLTASASYVYFQMPFSTFTNPDTIRIDFLSSQWLSSMPASLSNVGSALYVDNIYLKSSPLGIAERNTMKNIYGYPNPAQDVFSIKGLKQFSSQYVTIYDALGNRLSIHTLANGTDEINIRISDLPDGVYLYEIKSTDGLITRNKFVKQ